MIAVEGFSGRRVAVFGLAGSGLVAAHALAAGGAEIVCYDDKRARVDAAWDEGLPTGDLRVADFAAFDALLLSPGVPLTHPQPHWTVARAKAAGVEIVGDIELFDRERRARLPRMKLAAITGTNGKSTVTALTGHLLKDMGVNAQVGGNIGRPVLDLDADAAIAVVECSSYQIDLSPTIHPEVGAFLNLSPDHIDRHGSYENYAAVKTRLVAASDNAVFGALASIEAIANDFRLRGRKVWRFGEDRHGGPPSFPSAALSRGVLLRAANDEPGWDLVEVMGGEPRDLGRLPQVPSLRGDHNALNAAAALTIIAALGHDAKDAATHLATFPGLPHRMEEVGRDGDVAFINDSKATNAESAHQALTSFENIHWIAGGVPKDGGITSLKALFPRVRRAYLIGDAAADFADTLNGTVDVAQCGTLEAALEAAAGKAALEGGVVLLSPACASFDQFSSFEERGDRFRALVQDRLAGTQHGGADG
ncbi:MAG: UDP-N-acetylmuramoyl-L-alanine--D-glutamate ligase [Pseudomonadota bacterium]